MNWLVVGVWLATLIAAAIAAAIARDQATMALYQAFGAGVNVLMDLVIGVWPFAILNGIMLVFWLRKWWKNRRDKRRARDLIGDKTRLIRARMAQQLADRRIPVPVR